ncbi:hypothetical protein OG559_01495 [Micromonospora sp. NBC_01405]|uniref:hypothetical protein n=1 Tax=Micromonospora sp. NBC_01405 TaxID=2903589 RepID=UPI0032535A45
MSTIVLSRGIDAIGAGRKFRIYINDELVAKLGRSDRISLEVGAGKHVLRARLDWLRSAPLSVRIEADEVINVEVSAGGRAVSFVGTFLKSESALDLIVKPHV